MRKVILSLSILLAPSIGAAQSFVLKEKTITVAVIDTGGISTDVAKALKTDAYSIKEGLCKQGHKDFTGTGIIDRHGHGTNISGLIEREANGAHYCQLVMKYFDSNTEASNPLKAIRLALRAAIDAKVDFINISGGGMDYDLQERDLVVEALNKGITVVAAAGNEGMDLSRGRIATTPTGEYKLRDGCMTSAAEAIPDRQSRKIYCREQSNKGSKCNFYPACYDSRVVVVASLAVNGKDRSPTSNYGAPVDYMVVGEDQEGNGLVMTGTSQATAIVTGMLIKEKYLSAFLAKK
jgi:subtilisin family serine protease